MAAAERDVPDAVEPLSDSFLAALSPSALFSALVPWLSAPAPVSLAVTDHADQGESFKLQQKAQKVLINQFMWPKSGTNGVEGSSLRGGVAPPLSPHRAESLTLLALSFGRPAQGSHSEAKGYEGVDKRWELEDELTAREAAALMSSVPDRAGPQAPKLLQAQ